MVVGYPIPDNRKGEMSPPVTPSLCGILSPAKFELTWYENWYFDGVCFRHSCRLPKYTHVPLGLVSTWVSDRGLD